MKGDPPGFAVACMLMFTINSGKKNVPVNIDKLDDWMAQNVQSPQNMEVYALKRQDVVTAFLAEDDEKVGKLLAELHQSVHLQRALPLLQAGAKQKAERKVTNQKNAKALRPNGRTVDHDEIKTEFIRLMREGHTPREANGMLFNRGLASRSTIGRITKRIGH